jgi:hypothetical protein
MSELFLSTHSLSNNQDTAEKKYGIMLLLLRNNISKLWGNVQQEN